MFTKSIWTKLLTGVFALSLLVSCGGGGGGGGSAPPPLPPLGGGEGSVTSPVNLGTVTSTVSRSGSIGAHGSSYYRFTTGEAVGSYTISLTNTKSDLSWDLFSNSNFLFGYLKYCDNSTVPGPADEICTVSLSASTTYYLRVDEWDGVAGTYTLSITPPATSVLASPTGVTATAGMTTVRLTWNTVTNATSYRIYWSLTPGAGTSGTMISGITETSYLHTGLTPGMTYYYVVTAVNASGLQSAPSSQVSAVSLPAGTPLLSTNFDDGTLQGWTPTGTWGVTNVYSYSPSYSVTDSPSGNYTHDSNTWIMSPLLNLTNTSNPFLSFYHRYSIEDYFDNGYVEISTDNGSTWTILKRYTGLQTTFVRVIVDLTPYKASSQVRIRFRLATDTSVHYDGWYIDDIVVNP